MHYDIILVSSMILKKNTYIYSVNLKPYLRSFKLVPVAKLEANLKLGGGVLFFLVSIDENFKKACVS